MCHGHVRQWDPVHTVSMSRTAVGALRQRLPQALLLSDDLQMQGLQKTMPTAQALPLGLGAGLDLLLIGNNLVDEEHMSPALAEHLESAVERDAGLAAALSAARARVQDRQRRLRR